MAKLVHKEQSYTGGGAQIDDTTTSATKVWSSSKVNTQLGLKAEIDDTTTSVSTVWSSNKVNSLIGDVESLLSAL